MITQYTLQFTPYLSDNWQPITTYTDNSMSTTILVSAGQIAAYSKYRFRLIATNDYGSSYPSNELVISIAPLPSKPTLITKDLTKSSKTSITV